MNTKPEVPTGRKKELCEQIYAYIRDIYRTKEEICLHVFGTTLTPTLDRQIRDMINILKKHKPIVSPSSGKGYKAIINPADMEEVIHQWRENDSRIDDLKASNKPLIKFFEKHGGQYGKSVLCNNTGDCTLR